MADREKELMELRARIDAYLKRKKSAFANALTAQRALAPDVAVEMPDEELAKYQGPGIRNAVTRGSEAIIRGVNKGTDAAAALAAALISDRFDPRPQSAAPAAAAQTEEDDTLPPGESIFLNDPMHFTKKERRKLFSRKWRRNLRRARRAGP